MKRYLFGLHCPGRIEYFEDVFECDADAMVAARVELYDGKRKKDAFLISLYVLNGLDWHNIVNYE